MNIENHAVPEISAQDLPGSQVVKTPCSQDRGHQLIPCQGTRELGCCVEQPKKEKHGAQRMVGKYQDIGANIEGLPMAKSWAIWVTKSCY